MMETDALSTKTARLGVNQEELEPTKRPIFPNRPLDIPFASLLELETTDFLGFPQSVFFCLFRFMRMVPIYDDELVTCCCLATCECWGGKQGDSRTSRDGRNMETRVS
jgi:hypothetical protein